MEANKQAKLPAVVSATHRWSARTWRATTARASSASSIAKLRSHCVYLESAPVEIEIYIYIYIEKSCQLYD